MWPERVWQFTSAVWEFAAEGSRASACISATAAGGPRPGGQCQPPPSDWVVLSRFAIDTLVADPAELDAVSARVRRGRLAGPLELGRLLVESALEDSGARLRFMT